MRCGIVGETVGQPIDVVRQRVIGRRSTGHLTSHCLAQDTRPAFGGDRVAISQNIAQSAANDGPFRMKRSTRSTL